MKIEFLDDLTDGGKFPSADPIQLVRLFDFDTSQAKQLRHLIEESVIRDKRTIDLSQLDFMQAVNCNLILKVFDVDKGITTSDKENFVCELTIDKYTEMSFLMEPFSENINGYQWLYDLNTPIDFLFSTGGGW